MDGDAGIMVGIGNDITAVAEIIDSCIVTLIAAILREVHIQGIADMDSATCWFSRKMPPFMVPLLVTVELNMPPVIVP